MAAPKRGERGTFYPPFPVLGLASDGDVLLACGGGGSTASKEVPNVVQAFRHDEATGDLGVVAALNTEKSVAYALSSPCGNIWLASCRGACKMLRVDADANTIVEVGAIDTEHEGKEPTQNVARFSRCGKIIGTGGTDALLKLWRFAGPESSKPELLHSLKHDKEILDLDFSSDSSLVACCDKTGVWKIWNAAQGSLVWEGRYQSRNPKEVLNAKGLRFWDAPDGPMVFVTASGGRGPSYAGLFDTKGAKVREVLIHQKPCSSLALDAASGLAAVGLTTGGKKVYSLPGLRPVASCDQAHDMPAGCMAFVGPTCLASGGGDYTLNFYRFGPGSSSSYCAGFLRLVTILAVFVVILLLLLRLGLKAAPLQRELGF